MTDDPTREDIAAGRRVVQFLEDPAVKGALNQLADETVTRWQAEQDPAKREAYWHERNALLRLAQKLRAIVGRGQQAEDRLARLDNS